MKNLLDIARQNEGLSQMISFISELNIHQGLVLRFSDKFLLLYNLWKNNPSILKDLNSIFPPILFSRRWNDTGFETLNQFAQIYSTDLYTSILDVEELDNFKREIHRYHQKSWFMQYFRPLELVISLYNTTVPKDIKNFSSYLRDITKNKNFADFRIIFEKRSRNLLLKKKSKKKHEKIIGGISISNEDNYGTLGGILTNDSNDYFGLTCAHVANQIGEQIYQPAKNSSKKSRSIGTVEYASELSWSSRNMPCNHKFIELSENEKNMDVTLISIDNKIVAEKRILNLGQISGELEFNKIYQGMRVELNGSSSGNISGLVVGGIDISHRVFYETLRDEDVDDKFVTKEACFTNLIELRAPNPVSFCNNYFLHKKPVKHGDSGAWICTDDSSGYKWCGMLISGNSDRGYFLSAENIQDHLKKNGYQLNCTI